MNQNLYQQLILDHNRSPRNYGKMTNPSHFSEGYNALCGDHFLVYLKLDEKTQTIKEIKFSGDGCAISKASASMMSELIINKKLSEIKENFAIFKKLVKGEKLDPQEEKMINKLIIFANIYKYPSRVKCAILSWYTVIAALENKAKASSENITI